MRSDQATLARSVQVYREQLVSAQARSRRAVEGGADEEEREEMKAVVGFADVTYRRLRAAMADSDLPSLLGGVGTR